jgi:hypothetical protein
MHRKQVNIAPTPIDIAKGSIAVMFNKPETLYPKPTPIKNAKRGNP